MYICMYVCTNIWCNVWSRGRCGSLPTSTSYFWKITGILVSGGNEKVMRSWNNMLLGISPLSSSTYILVLTSPYYAIMNLFTWPESCVMCFHELWSGLVIVCVLLKFTLLWTLCVSVCYLSILNSNREQMRAWNGLIWPQIKLFLLFRG
jgi:hypothetical protein